MSKMGGSEIKSLMTLSSRSDVSLSHGRVRYLNPPLHERCTMLDMEKLHDAFLEAYRGQLFPDEFRRLLRELLNVEYDDEEFKILFLKINTNRDGAITWEELVSHLLLGFYADDPENQRESLEPPILGLPKVIRSMHRHPISRIQFCPDVEKDRSFDMMLGSYMTASRDGMINWWSLNMTLNRTAYSCSPHLKVRNTWVTDMVCMPDVNIIATSSTERELRFYDCTANTFTLKIIITSWEYMICTMHYYFPRDEDERCMLICGDVGGNVRVLLFSPILRGPFQSQAARALIQLRHIDLQKRPKLLPSLQLVEFQRVHAEWVRQVSFYASLHCVVSCATCPDALLMADIHGSKTHNMFRCEKGIQCFVFDEEAHMLVTGGPDCSIRVWNPFVPSEANALLTGHHAGIITLVLQHSAQGQLLYSLSRDRVIKVWDIAGQVCLQTYIDIPTQIGERTPLTAVYNSATRDFIVGAIKIAIITFNEQLNAKYTDGSTHSRIVSKILYNPLFKVVITCGMDSIIFNWDPITGKRNMMVRDAHTRALHGEVIPVEITAACFDPGFQLLLTGARNGTLKVWNFNNGECLRNMSIAPDMEVTGVFWIEGCEGSASRIFSVGWDKHVTEWEASGASGASAGGAENGKAWDTRHTDDILAAAVRSPQALATSSYNSELIFWKLETGQPYRRFSCTDPTLRIKMHYTKRDQVAVAKPAGGGGASASGSAHKTSVRRPSYVDRGQEQPVDPGTAVQKAQARRVSAVGVPSRARIMRQLAVHAMIYLETRPFNSQVAGLFLSLENGSIQAWSDHPAGGLRGSFQAIHTTGDYVAAFATDVKNDYLFTGTTVGYIKVWLMKNYLKNEEIHVNMPALRLEFPFLWRDRIEGRAKRAVRDQPLPLLLNSYRAHMRCVTTLAYIDEHKLLLSGSADYSVRVWRLTGEYINTLGGIVTPWTLDVTRFPPDVKKVASFTTFKVWRGGYVSRYTPGQVEVDHLRDITDEELRTKTYGQPAPEPLLGNYFELPRRPDRQDPIELDDSLPTIPLYCHLRLAATTPIRRPPTPELVRQTRLKKSSADARRTHFEKAKAAVAASNAAAAEKAAQAEKAQERRTSDPAKANERRASDQKGGERRASEQKAGERRSSDKAGDRERRPSDKAGDRRVSEAKNAGDRRASEKDAKDRRASEARRES